mmetsp:Transcript_33422/g.76996  ORF Transcript_33422/g.76996 Transcript_33422/m.76996 type:complete len:208 (-) Transcript_33422:908-1531(-)
MRVRSTSLMSHLWSWMIFPTSMDLAVPRKRRQPMKNSSTSTVPLLSSSRSLKNVHASRTSRPRASKNSRTCGVSSLSSKASKVITSHLSRPTAAKRLRNFFKCFSLSSRRACITAASSFWADWMALWQNTPVTTFKTAKTVNEMYSRKQRTHAVDICLKGSNTSCQLTPPDMLMNRLSMLNSSEPQCRRPASDSGGLLGSTWKSFTA